MISVPRQVAERLEPSDDSSGPSLIDYSEKRSLPVSVPDYQTVDRDGEHFIVSLNPPPPPRTHTHQTVNDGEHFIISRGAEGPGREILHLPRRRRPGTGDIATPPVRLSVCLSVRPSVCLSVCPSRLVFAL